MQQDDFYDVPLLTTALEVCIIHGLLEIASAPVGSNRNGIRKKPKKKKKKGEKGDPKENIQSISSWVFLHSNRAMIL
jgi:hypothetical protein